MGQLETPRDVVGRGGLSVFLCLFAAIFEGLDIQSMGVAAPRLAQAFRLGPADMGLVMSASTFGLMIGAAIGGWLSDRIGRVRVLTGSMTVLGVLSIITVLTQNTQELIAVRIFAGLGLGGVFPNLIAIVSEAVAVRYRATALGAVYCGLPLGGVLAGYLMAITPPPGWKSIFIFGGVGPIFLCSCLLFLVPSAANIVSREGAVPKSTASDAIGLFGSNTLITLLLWLSYFFTLFAIYIQLNWMPSFLRAEGASPSEAGMASIALNLGAISGSLLIGRALDLFSTRTILSFSYVGMMASLLALTLVHGQGVLPAAFVVGFFVIGGQLTLYAMPSMMYSSYGRGLGVGAAVAAGRCGAIAGPILAGICLAKGMQPNAVPLLAEPGLIVAGVAMFWVATRAQLR